MSNIVERLRSPATVFYEYAADNGAFLREAADEITRLRAENSKNKSLIGELLYYAESLEGRLDSHDLDMLEDVDIKSRARAAIEGVTEKSGAVNE